MAVHQRGNLCVCAMLSACYFHCPHDTICISKEHHSHCCELLTAAENDYIQKVIHLQLKPGKAPSQLHSNIAGRTRAIWSNGFLKLPLHQCEGKGDEWQATRMLQCSFHSSTGFSFYSTGEQAHAISHCGCRVNDYHLTRLQHMQTTHMPS